MVRLVCLIQPPQFGVLLSGENTTVLRTQGRFNPTAIRANSAVQSPSDSSAPRQRLHTLLLERILATRFIAEREPRERSGDDSSGVLGKIQDAFDQIIAALDHRLLHARRIWDGCVIHAQPPHLSERFPRRIDH